MFFKSKYKFWLICLFAFSCLGLVLYAQTRSPQPPIPLVRFGFGKPAKPQEIRRLDIDVRADGTGLPAGEGIAKSGLLIYTEKCLACHGKGEPSDVKLPGGELFGRDAADNVKTIGNYWPYATTIFDYVRRSMPYNAPGSLTNQEVYHLTAYLLFANGIIREDFVLDEKTLPQVVMPARDKFVNDDRTGGTKLR